MFSLLLAFLFLSRGLAISTTPTTTTCAPTHIPTIWLAGDSTTAPGGGHNGTEGWGQYLQYSFLLTSAFVNNSAYAGRSMRSFTREGRFEKIKEMVTEGDWVVIEMGINDGGPVGDGKGRGVCPGSGNEICVDVYQNQTEVVLTFVQYQLDAAKLMLDAGAKIILSSREPTNPWESGNFSYTPDRFTYYARLASEELGGPENGVWFLDHGTYSAEMMKSVGKEFVDGQFPMDNTHTAPKLAELVSKAWVLALKSGSAGLAGLSMNATVGIESQYGLGWQGTSLMVNKTVAAQV